MAAHPELRLFRLSPVADALDLAARAFPIFQPQPKITDERPLTAPPSLPAVSGLPAQTGPGILPSAGISRRGAAHPCRRDGRLQRLEQARRTPTDRAPTDIAMNKAMNEAMNNPMIEFERATKRFGRKIRGRRLLADRRRATGCRPVGAERRGQDHGHQVPARPAALRGDDPHRRAGRTAQWPRRPPPHRLCAARDRPLSRYDGGGDSALLRPAARRRRPRRTASSPRSGWMTRPPSRSALCPAA